jgi:hypothetical protein
VRGRKLPLFFGTLIKQNLFSSSVNNNYLTSARIMPVLKFGVEYTHMPTFCAVKYFFNKNAKKMKLPIFCGNWGQEYTHLPRIVGCSDSILRALNFL